MNKNETALLSERITIDPEICHGKPCIRGLRYPVEMILELLSAEMTIEEILADYEDLERADIVAVLTFAAKLSQVKRMQAIVGMKFLVDAQLPLAEAFENHDFVELSRIAITIHE